MTSLYALILIPLIAAVGVVLRPAKDAKAIAMLGALAALGATVWTMCLFQWDTPSFQFQDELQWLPSFGGLVRDAQGTAPPRPWAACR